MSWQMGDRGLVYATTGIYVDCVDDLVGGFGILIGLVLSLILSRRSE